MTHIVSTESTSYSSRLAGATSDIRFAAAVAAAEAANPGRVVIDEAVTYTGAALSVSSAVTVEVATGGSLVMTSAVNTLEIQGPIIAPDREWITLDTPAGSCLLNFHSSGTNVCNPYIREVPAVWFDGADMGIQTLKAIWVGGSQSVVVLPHGSYNCSTSIIPADVPGTTYTIHADDRGTTLTWTGGAAGHLCDVETEVTSITLRGITLAGTVHGAWVHDDALASVLTLVIENCRFEASGNAVTQYDGNDGRPIDLLFRNNYYNNSNLTNSPAIYLRYSCTKARIENNYFQNCERSAIAIGRDEDTLVPVDVVISGNRIIDTWAASTKECHPIFVRGGDMRITNNHIEGNTPGSPTPANDNEGIYASGAQKGSIISDNVLVNSGDAAISIKGGKAIVDSNRIFFDASSNYDTTEVGVHLQTGDKSIIANNQVEGAQVGFEVQHSALVDGGDALITGNMTLDCSRGLKVTTAGSDVVVSNNQFVGGVYGVLFNSHTGVDFDITNQVVSNNYFSDQSIRAILFSCQKETGDTGNVDYIDISGNVLVNTNYAIYVSIEDSQEAVPPHDNIVIAHNRLLNSGWITETISSLGGRSVVVHGNVIDYTVSTTNDTITTLASIATQDDVTHHVLADVVGVETGDHDESASYRLMATFQNDGGTLTKVGTTTTLHSAETTGTWDCVLTPSAANILCRVTGGPATTNVNWRGRLEIDRVG